MPADHDIEELLRTGRIEILGRMPRSSNATFLARVCTEAGTVNAIYKPRRGERALWDFPDGIFRREVAAYVLSRQLGWDLVPVTVAVPDGPFGEGSLQQFVETDPDEHYFTMRSRAELFDQLRRVCLFDLVSNNTDRKSGHCLLGDGDHVWAIDNALCFHAQFKLRTVIWEFSGDRIPPDLVHDVEQLCADGPDDALQDLLPGRERQALVRRCEAILATGEFPHDETGRRLPWPMV